MKIRFVIPAAIFAILFIAFALMLRRTDEGYDPTILASPLIGKPVPAFRVPRLDDPSKLVSSDDFKGSAYVLNVWGTWCVECRHEHPLLLKIASENVVPIVGLDAKDDLNAAQRWLQTLGNPYAAVGFDEDGRVALNLGVYGAPETFLIDEQGVVTYKLVGVLTPEIWEKEFLPRIRKDGTGS